MRIFLVTVLIELLLVGPAFEAQSQADSLATLEGSMRVKALLQAAEEHANNHSDKALEFARRAISLSEELDDDSSSVKGWYIMGQYSRKQGDFLEAIRYFEKGLDKNKRADIPRLEADLLNYTGVCQKHLGRYHEAMDFYEQALAIRKEIEDKKGIAGTLLNIGVILKNDKRYKTALEYYQESKQIYTDEGYKPGIANCLNNIGNVYRLQKDHQKALTTMMECLALNKEIDSKRGMAYNYMNIGLIYQRLQEFENAERYYLQSLEIRRDMGDKSGAAYCYHNLADLSRERGDPDGAIEYMVESQLRTNQTGDKHLEMENLLVMSQIYEDKNDLGQALRFYKDYAAMRDTLEQRFEDQKITMLEHELALRKEDQFNKSQRSEIQSAKLTRNLVVITLAFVLLLLVLVGIGYYDKRVTNRLLRKQNEQISKQAKDISQQNDVMETKTELLEKSNRKLTEINYEKNQILGIVAHDLKSPLNAIKGFALLMQEEQDDMNEDQKDYLDHILGSVERMGDLIGRLLDINAIEENRIDLRLEKADLNSLVANTVNNFEAQARDKKITLATELPQVPAESMVDKKLLAQVFDNLISNAIKFSPPGKQVKVSLSNGQERFRIKVADEGPGINEEDRKRLFSKFSKLSNRPTGNESSTGLGLFIVKELMDLMGGKVWYEPRKEEGACFVIEL